MHELANKIKCGDCIKILAKTSEPFADLIFADPPFNIGYEYDKYDDRVAKDEYVKWTKKWMSACVQVLKPNGSFYVAIGDEYVANVKLIAEDELKLHMRNWIIWHYTFGQQAKTKFARAHTHILYFVKDKDNFIFNDSVSRVFSDRQTIYNDKRANPDGKLPDDVWNEFPRVCGTFEERTGWHPCQMPESVLARIIRASSDPGQLVLDPFSGSGTTCVVAHKLNRFYTGIEISGEYTKASRTRINKSESLPVEGEGPAEWNSHLKVELKWLYHENKVSTEQLDDSPYLLALFTSKFNQRAGRKTHMFTPENIRKKLRQLRKSGKLGPMVRKTTQSR